MREVGTFCYRCYKILYNKTFFFSIAVIDSVIEYVIFFPFQLTSQHPYMETFVGKPHVYTIDINDLELVESTLKEILSLEVSLSSGSEVQQQQKYDSISLPFSHL